FKKMMEAESKAEALTLVKLTESNIEKAEIVLAVKGEIVDKLQRQAEVINNMGVDVLGPLLDRIKAEHGIESADAFRNNISGLLEQAVKTLMDVKDKISTETLKLTGDITNAPDVSDIGGEDVSLDIDTPDFDFEGDAEFSDDLVEPVPAEREMRESVKPRIGLKLESNKGTIGTKFFESKTEAKKWLTENQNKVKRVIGFTK
ncbi:hypothetical protein C7180_22715, partial [Salmonella enterica]|nr:hypothetical protein [Salmonella enterica]